ncbi:MAG: PEP-CTERM sorting domain-containing protein [Pseudomonadota bacterium]
MTLRHFTAAAMLSAAFIMPAAAQADLIEINFGGTFAGSSDPGFVDGDTFTGRMVLDTAIADQNSVTTAATIYASNAGLVDFKFTATRGAFSLSLPTAGPNFETSILQTHPPTAQVVQIIAGDFTFQPDGFTGALDGFSPALIRLQIDGRSPIPSLFNDISSLLSDAESFSPIDYLGRLDIGYSNGREASVGFGTGDLFSINLLGNGSGGGDDNGGGNNGGGNDGGGNPPTTVSEPGVLAMFGLGLIGLVGMRRRT